MIYLLKSYIKSGCIYKIGYAKDFSQRFQQYYFHNPGIESISTREGDLLFESKLHLYLSHRYSKYRSLDEWYHEDDNKQILLDFHDNLFKINKYLWKHRSEIFREQDFRKNQVTNRYPLNKEIYEELLNLLGKNLRMTDIINPDKTIIRNNLQEIDKIYYRKSSRKLSKFDNFENSPSYINEFLKEFSEENWFDKKMKLYCEFIKKFYPLLGTTNIPGVPQEYQNYVNLLGPDRCKALGYYQASLEREYQVITSGDTRKEVILNNFQIQQRYSLKEIKEKVREIYQNLGITKTPKASDLEEYFEVKKTKITTPDGVKDGYLIEKIR